MAAIHVATALLIFITVNSKAVTQSADEINAKGIRLVKTLASIDASYWKVAIGSTAKEAGRRSSTSCSSGPAPEGMTARLARTCSSNTPNCEDVRRTHGGPPRSAPHAQERQEGTSARGNDNPPDHRRGHLVGENAPSGSVQAIEGLGQLGISTQAGVKIDEVLVSDGRDKGSGQDVRLFTLDRETPGVGRFKFYVILSLARINEAREALRSSILLPVLVSVLMGIGIAIWISTLITNPIKILMRDMTEVSSGNLEHQTVARSKDEVGLLAQTFSRMTTALRAAHAQEIQSKAMEHDLAIASEIQSNLVPKRMLKVPGYDISAYYRPSKEVGGDYYDFIEVDDGQRGHHRRRRVGQGRAGVAGR
jgi:HAMP domain-containing protein